MSKLKGKVAVVTGASKGIGAAIAKALAAEGASVVVNYASSKAGADKVVAAITAAGGKAVAVGGDVSKAADAQGLIAAAIKNYGRLDILVNNSGVYEFSPIESVTEESFHRLFNINVLGVLLTTQAAVKHLGEGASIINIGSGVSRITPPNSSVYTGTKVRSMPLQACSRASSGRGRSASTPLIPDGRDRRHGQRRFHRLGLRKGVSRASSAWPHRPGRRHRLDRFVPGFGRFGLADGRAVTGYGRHSLRGKCGCEGSAELV